MIKHPLVIVLYLFFLEWLVLTVSSKDRFKKYFSFFPPVFWIYFLPMLSAALHVIDSKSSIYGLVIIGLLPASLLLLLVGVDMKAIMKLGPLALGMFFIGSFGIIVGTPFVFFIFERIVGPQFWSGFGALSASWIGGSANMIAVKEALGTPENIFLPMVIVDTVVPYVWMGMWVLLIGFQPVFDRWNHSKREIIDHLTHQVKSESVPAGKPFVWDGMRIFYIIALAAIGSILSRWIALGLDQINSGVSVYAWTIIIVSIVGIGLSLTRVRELDKFGASRIGNWILYFVLTSIGARANIIHIGNALVLLAAGFCIVAVHGIILVIGARLLRAPMALVAIASQANIGGVASAPILAAMYQPSLASVGLLLAILGGIVGTYFGIFIGQICHLISLLP